MEELKPCPVCKTSQYVYAIPADEYSEKFVCVCNICGFGECYEPKISAEDAEEDWNRRHKNV